MVHAMALAGSLIALEFATSPWVPTTNASLDTAAAFMGNNLGQATDLIRHARESAEGLPVIVLPEYALTGPDLPSRDAALPFLFELPALPEHSDGPLNASLPNPCHQGASGQQGQLLVRISCLARELQVDLVLGIGEVVFCATSEPSCPADGRHQYNVQLAVLADGRLANKYRKSHLYYEPQFEPGPERPRTFVASDGRTRVGLLICFDIMFPKPAVQLAQLADLVAYSTWWVNYPPLLTGTQVQSGWQRHFGRPLVAAGTGAGGVFNSGSGVYTSGAPGAASMQWFNTNWTTASAAVVWPASNSGSAVAAEHVAAAAPSRPVPVSNRVSGKIHGTLNISMAVFDARSVAASGWQYSLDVTSPDGYGCSVGFARATPASSPAASTTFAAFSATGIYNSLFPAKMCGVIACPSGALDCFEDLGTLAGGAGFEGLSVTAPATAGWQVLGQGAWSGGLAMLDNEVEQSATGDNETVACSSDQRLLALLSFSLQLG